MRTQILRLAGGVILATSVYTFCLVGQTAMAKDIFQDACPSGSTSQTCQSKTTDNPLIGTNGLLYKIAGVVAIIAGIAAVIVMIVGGIKYITSGGDAQKITSAKHTIVGALIGLVVIVLAQTIITFVIKRL